MSGSSDSDSEVEELNSAFKKLEFLRSHKDFKHLIAKEKEVGRGSTSREKLALKIDPDFTGTFLMNPQNFDSRKDTIGLWPPKLFFLDQMKLIHLQSLLVIFLMFRSGLSDSPLSFGIVILKNF